jgi:DNA-binding CsgD family transcriptional regulator
LELAKPKTGRVPKKKTKIKTLTPRQIDELLPRLRQKKPVDWGNLTDRQELCARLRWHAEMKVSEIACLLGLHHSTVQEHLTRVTVRTTQEGGFNRRKKQQAVTNRMAGS